MAIKRILNTTTGRYYKLRERTTSAGNVGQIMGLWSPKRTAGKTSSRTSQKKEICQKCTRKNKNGNCGYKCYEHDSDKFTPCDICGQIVKNCDIHNDQHVPEWYSQECEECGRNVCEDCTSRLSERDDTNDVVCIKCEPKKRG